MPTFPCEFELPDDWLVEAGFTGFVASTPAFRSRADAILVPIHEIEPPARARSAPLNWRGFDRARLVRVLEEIVAGDEIEPVPLMKLTPGNLCVPVHYGYRVRNGFHRFYASVVARFECLPAEVLTKSELRSEAKRLG